MPLRGNVMLLLGQPSQSTFVRLSVLPYYLFSPTHVLSHPSIWMAIVLLYCRLKSHLKIHSCKQCVGSLQSRARQ